MCRLLCVCGLNVQCNGYFHIHSYFQSKHCSSSKRNILVMNLMQCWPVRITCIVNNASIARILLITFTCT